MRLSTQVKPISFFKANAARIIDDLDSGGQPLVVTKNGEAKAVVMSVYDYEQMEERLSFLKILDLADRNIAEGKVRPARDVIAELRAKLDDAGDA